MDDLDSFWASPALSPFVGLDLDARAQGGATVGNVVLLLYGDYNGLGHRHLALSR